MSNFSHAEVGDKVFDLCYGEGQITRVEDDTTYPIHVTFKDTLLCAYGETYDVTGRQGCHHILPRLYWAKPEIIAQSQPLRLTPCPFCASRTAPKLFTDDDDEVSVACNRDRGGCGAFGPFRKSQQQAAYSWNRRL